MWELILKGYKNPTDKKGTLRSYEATWRKFVEFCGKNTKRALGFDSKDVANFATKLYADGATGASVSAAITALDETRGIYDPGLPPIKDCAVIKKLRRAAKIRRPSKKKSSQPKSYFDPVVIFKYLAKLGKDIKFSADKMRTKVATLMLLDGGLRVNELTKIYVENITFGNRKVDVKIPWPKEERKSSWTYVSFHCSCVAQIIAEEQRELDEEDLRGDLSDFEMAGPLWRASSCSFCSLKDYIKNSSKRRSNCSKESYESPQGQQEGSPLFLTHKSMAKGIAMKSLRKAIKQVMKQAGIDQIWTVHDCRGACASKLYNLGCTKRRCREYGRWTGSKTLDDHYLKIISYKERAQAYENLPVWELLRMTATQLDES